MNDFEKYLKVLGLEHGATSSQIKAAYAEMLFLWHPDRFKQGDSLQAKAHEKTVAINEAYERLRTYTAAMSHEAETTGVPESAKQTSPNYPQATPSAQSPKASPSSYDRQGKIKGLHLFAMIGAFAAAIILASVLWSEKNNPPGPTVTASSDFSRAVVPAPVRPQNGGDATRAIPFRGVISRIDTAANIITVGHAQTNRNFIVTNNSLMRIGGKLSTMRDLAPGNGVRGSYWKRVDNSFELKSLEVEAIAERRMP